MTVIGIVFRKFFMVRGRGDIGSSFTQVYHQTGDALMMVMREDGQGEQDQCCQYHEGYRRCFLHFMLLMQSYIIFVKYELLGCLFY